MNGSTSEEQKSFMHRIQFTQNTPSKLKRFAKHKRNMTALAKTDAVYTDIPTIFSNNLKLTRFQPDPDLGGGAGSLSQLPSSRNITEA